MTTFLRDNTFILESISFILLTYPNNSFFALYVYNVTLIDSIYFYNASFSIVKSFNICCLTLSSSITVPKGLLFASISF